MEQQTDLSGLVDDIVSLNDNESPMSLREAANSLTDYRNKRDAQASQEAAAPAQPAAAPPPEIPSQEETAAPPQEATGEEATVTSDPAQEPLLDLPRSWAKDRAESWAKLDRDTQQMLLDHDSKATLEIRRTQNEHAEQRKALEAERTKLEQAQKQYEEALPILMQTLQEQQQGQFSDIKTMADVERMAREDWPRYALWDAHQKKVAAVNAELQASQQRQIQEYKTQFTKFAQEQDSKFVEAVPEMKDPAKAEKISKAGIDLLQDLGFTQDELTRTWNGDATISLRDHRIQRLVVDAVRYRQAKAAAPNKVQKPVPVVQRPGSPASRASDADVEIARLSKLMDEKPSLRNATELLKAQRAARR